MMVVAERDDVGDDGRSAVFPVDDVMRLGPAVRSRTAGIAATAVANLAGPVDLGWDRAPGSADVEGEAVLAGDDSADGAVTQHPFDVGPVEGAGVFAVHAAPL